MTLPYQYNSSSIERIHCLEMKRLNSERSNLRSLVLVVSCVFTLEGACAYLHSQSYQQIDALRRPDSSLISMFQSVKQSRRFGDFHLHRPSHTPPKLYSSSMKFKNFDGMLDAFRDESVLVYFSSEICGPCKLQRKELATVRNILDSTNSSCIKILTVDAGVFPQVGLRYSIAKIPCLLLIKHGEVVLQLEGLTKAEDLVHHVQANIDRSQLC
jgi:thiol-disulfide isomerase/thioredoxin